MGRILFITGTDTGVGKSVLTALLLCHLRQSGVHALGMKPFSSGTRGDARLLFELNDGELPLDAVNPFHFSRPLAPFIAARMEQRNVSLRDVVTRIRQVRAQCDVLLVEGAGGLLVPLGEGFDLSDLMLKLKGTAVLTARNQIGVINHVLLSMRAIKNLEATVGSVVLMGQRSADLSARSNGAVLRELLRSSSVLEMPVLRGDLESAQTIRRHARTHCRSLGRLVRLCSLNGKSVQGTGLRSKARSVYAVGEG